MKKKEKTLRIIGRMLARAWVISAPAAIVLSVLVLLDEVSWKTAGLLFLGVLILTMAITAAVFHELENFISYLKSLAQGIEIEPPRFQKGIFSSFRLADTFQSVKKRWFDQTLSDASILEHLSDPLMMINPEGKIVFINQKARSVFGDKADKMNCLSLFAEDVFQRAVSNVLAEKTTTELFEWSYQHFVFQTRIDRLPAPTRDGGIAVIVMNDITPFKRFREQQAEFFANASHELKTPLSIISGFIETLQGPAKDDEVVREQFLNMMAEQTTRMTGLVQDLLRLARQQAMPESSKKEVIILPDLIRGVMADLKHKAIQNHQKLICRTDYDIPRLLGNRSELQHVFQNLIDNAIKYGKPHSDIDIQLGVCNGFPNRPEDKRQTVSVAVHNQGTPIASKHLDKLFDRFYRVDSVQARQVGGTGLGLSIVQQIVHDHDGMIDVASTIRDGTTFTVYLPVDL